MPNASAPESPSPAAVRLAWSAELLTQIAAVGGAEAETGKVACRGPAPGRVSDGSLDARPSSRIDRRRIRGAVSPGPCLEDPDRAGLELPEAGAPRGGTRRGCDRAVEAWGMAAVKKR